MLNQRSNIVNNLGKGIHLATLDTLGVPEPLKYGFMQAHSNFGHGTCLEFGVCWGHSWMWQVLNILNFFPKSRLIGFDSWQGLPKETPGVWAPDRHKEGAFCSPKENVLARMDDIGAVIGDQFKLVDGFFCHSLTEQLRSQIENLIFVNVDVDIHSSTIEVLNWIRPMLQVGTVIYWDDWCDPIDVGKGAAEWGEHLACRQWLEQNPNIKLKLIALNDVNQRAHQVVSL